MRRFLAVFACTPGLPLVYCHWSNTEVARRNVAALKEELQQPDLSRDRAQWAKAQLALQQGYLEQETILYQTLTFPPPLEL